MTELGCSPTLSSDTLCNVQELDPTYILDAMVRLRRAQPPVFGADVHEFRLGPTKSEADICEFEQKHNVKLPNDYRQFLVDIGNGGAGPFYGVFPLGEMDSNFGLRSWQENDGFIGDLSESFPLERAWNDVSAMPSDDLAERDEAEYDRQMEAFDTVYWRPSLVNGAIPICHEGCALRVWLVVTGSFAGHLWEDRRTEYAGLKPLQLGDGSLAKFSVWYREWLEGCLATIAK